MTRIAALVAIGTMTLVPALAVQAQQPQPTPPPPPASAPSQPAATTGPSGQGLQVGSDAIVGSTVRDNQGRDVGKVSRLMIDPNDGKITNLVVESGGRLGTGGKTFSLPWSAVKIGQDEGKVIVTASQMLEPTPARQGASDSSRKQ